MAEGSSRGWVHRYVDAHVWAFRKIGLTRPAPIPEWIENLLGWPENASEGRKDWAYVLGHVTAFVAPPVALLCFAL